MIFVFGSNLAGRHGKGAALYAARHCAAERGVGEGRTGNAYALPTKDERLQTRHLLEIEASIRLFVDHARSSADETFFLTPVGTGLAGHNKRDIWALLERVGLPSNVVLASTWISES